MTYISWFSDIALYLEGYWGINMIPWNNESVWLDSWPQNKSGSLWPIFHGSVILLYIEKAIRCLNRIPWNNESVWLDAWPQNKIVSLRPIFYGSVILPYILKAIWCLNRIPWNNESVWLDARPQKKVGHCDRYFMVQWFCLISWRLFELLTWYLGIRSQYDLMLDLKIKVGHCDLYFMVQWFCLIY